MRKIHKKVKHFANLFLRERFFVQSYFWEAKNENYCKSKNLFCKTKKIIIFKNYDFSRTYKDFFAKLSPFSQVGVPLSHS